MRGALRSQAWVILATMIAAVGALGWVQPKQKPAGGSAQSDMKKSFNAATKQVKLPQEARDALAAFAGSFDTASEVQLAPAPAEPLKARGATTAKWIMGGLFVQANSTAAPDEELKGDRLIIYGYDIGSKKYTMWQIESGSTTAATATGDYDAATRTFTFDGEKDMGPVKKAPVSWVIHVEGDGTLKQVIKVKSANGQAREFVRVTHTPKARK